MKKTTTIGMAYLFILAIATNIVCTQFVAGKFGYHAALGKPLYAHFYNPFDWWRWAFSFFNHSPAIYSQAFGICATGIFFALVGLRLIVGINSRSSKKHEGVHGTAHFATTDEVLETGLIAGKSNDGVYCGGYYDADTDLTHYLRDKSQSHIALIAPTGSGKGVGPIICTLLSHPHSLFAYDPKSGELYAITAGWRKQGAKNIVLRFEPGEPDVGCSWNALEEIRFQTRYQVKDAQQVSLIIMDSDGKGIHGDHWRTAAHELIYGVILHALYKSREVGRMPALPDCAHMLTGTSVFSPDTDEEEIDDGDPRALQALFTEMANVTLDDSDQAAREAQVTIRSVGRSMLDKASKELASIISTANNALSLYRDPIVAGNTSRSEFKVSDLMDHDRPVSLYFITNPDDLDRIKPLARLLLTQIVLRLATRMEFSEGRAKTAHKHELLLMLDEFPSLGKLEVFQSALAYIRGFGMKAIIVMQDIEQLYGSYTRHESIISNCNIRIAYAPNKLETAEWLSKMTGQTTVITEQISTSGKRFGTVLGQVSTSFQEKSRYLMTPNEVQTMPGPVKDENGNILEPGEMLIFVAGHPVIRGRQILYFLDPVFSKRSKMPPPKVSDVARTNPKGIAI